MIGGEGGIIAILKLKTFQKKHAHANGKMVAQLFKAKYYF